MTLHASRIREEQSLPIFLTFARTMRRQWFDSIGIDVQNHWALFHHQFRNPKDSSQLLEIDLILGNFDKGGMPRNDDLVAVEVKCWPQSRAESAGWNSAGPRPNSNLWKQVKRNSRLGFSRVAAVEILVTPGTNDFVRAAGEAASVFTSEGSRLRAAARPTIERFGAGYAICCMGEINGMSAGQAGAFRINVEAKPETKAQNPKLDLDIQLNIPKYQMPSGPNLFRSNGGSWTSVSDR